LLESLIEGEKESGCFLIIAAQIFSLSHST
jgi:hypothetical protein